MSQNMNIINLVGRVFNPFTSRSGDNVDVPLSAGRQGELLTSEFRGKYANAASRGALFSANVTAVTLPVIAATLASKFALVNPVGSGVDLELVDFDMGTVLATTVVDTVGIYESHGNNAATATLTTAGVVGTNVFTGQLNASGAPKGQFFSALTHVGTPVRVAILGFFGATTTTWSGSFHVDFDGKIIVPEGTIISVAMSTAASTASGVDLGIRWLEIPNK